jgi:hypothetical protein
MESLFYSFPFQNMILLKDKIHKIRKTIIFRQWGQITAHVMKPKNKSWCTKTNATGKLGSQADKDFDKIV